MTVKKLSKQSSIPLLQQEGSLCPSQVDVRVFIQQADELIIYLDQMSPSLKYYQIVNFAEYSSALIIDNLLWRQEEKFCPCLNRCHTNVSPVSSLTRVISLVLNCSIR